jgi:hypothetical protein
VNVRAWLLRSGPSSARAAQRLEGSRFVGWHFCSLAATERLGGEASGSRERLIVMQPYQRCALIRFRTGPICKNIALGGSREPPASWSCCVSGRVCSAPAERSFNAQKRLPSRRWECNAALSHSRTACPTKLYVPWMAVLSRSEVGRTKRRLK